MVWYARYVRFQLAALAAARQLYQTILRRIRRFAAITPGPGQHDCKSQ